MFRVKRRNQSPLCHRWSYIYIYIFYIYIYIFSPFILLANDHLKALKKEKLKELRVCAMTIYEILLGCLIYDYHNCTAMCYYYGPVVLPSNNLGDIPIG